MPLEPYYEHGGLDRKNTNFHKAIFIARLSNPREAPRLIDIKHAVSRELNVPLTARHESGYAGTIAAHVEHLVDLKFLETRPGPDTRYTINPSILDKVAKFVKSKK